jgi:bacterioferritin (cytochrome b1)
VGDADERLDTKEAISRLNEALALQYRSVNQYTLNSASLFGFQFQSLGDRLWQFAQAELADARKLVEKIVALGGSPTTEAAPLEWSGEPDAAVDRLVETEGQAVEALQNAIEPTGREGRSEALEHMLEHVIMRKQDQIDFLVRARRRS